MFMGAPALGVVASTRLWPGWAAAEATALSPAATAVTFGFEVAGAVPGGGAGGGGGTANTRPLGVWTRKLAGWLAKIAARPPPVVPHYAMVRVVREAGTRMAHVQQCEPPGQAALCLRCARYRWPARIPRMYGTAAARRTCEHKPPPPRPWPLPLPRPPWPLPMPLPPRVTSSSTITWEPG